MEFTVVVPDAEELLFYGESTFRLDNGALVVDDEDGRTITYGPTGWLRVEQPPAAPE